LSLRQTNRAEDQQNDGLTFDEMTDRRGCRGCVFAEAAATNHWPHRSAPAGYEFVSREKRSAQCMWDLEQKPQVPRGLFGARIPDARSTE